jgi:hypothetical protein
MTTPDPRLERGVADLLADLAPTRPPADLIPETERALDETRRWPRWLANLKESPMRYRSRLVVGSPATRMAAIAVATLLVALLGVGAIVVGAQSPAPTPPEDTAAQAPTAFSGHIECGPEVRSGTTTIRSIEGGGSATSRRDYAWQQTATMSDPRLDGTAYLSGTYVTYRLPGPGGDLEERIAYRETQRIVNDGGAWQGSMNTFVAPDERDPERGTRLGTADNVYTYLLVGEGGYEGLTAIYDQVWDRACGFEVTGLILEGDLPAAEPFIPEQ